MTEYQHGNGKYQFNVQGNVHNRTVVQPQPQKTGGTYGRIHTSPVDPRHQIEVWENNVTGHRYFLPMYSRTGRTWANYMDGGTRVATLSYESAMNYIRVSNRNQSARRGR